MLYVLFSIFRYVFILTIDSVVIFLLFWSDVLINTQGLVKLREVKQESIEHIA